MNIRNIIAELLKSIIKKFENLVNMNNQKNSKGIEVGHIFYFGTKYSAKLNSLYLDNEGCSKPMHSGSYGIGVSRLVAAIIEARNDEKGIIWPMQLAPFKIGLINVRKGDNLSTEFSEKFYSKFIEKYDLLYEDRDIRLGQKLNIFDLIANTSFK